MYSTDAPTSYALTAVFADRFVTNMVEFGGCSGLPQARGSKE